MLKDANFLCEIGTEEIPAGYLPTAIESITRLMRDSLSELRIDFADVAVYATPRRLAIMAAGLAASQRNEEVELKGPAAKAAYDAAKSPTQALQGFLKGNGVALGDVYVRDTGKGEYVFAKKRLESRDTSEIIPGLIEKIVVSSPFPKRMRWSDKSVTFPRPIAYFLILFNDRVIPLSIDGIASSNLTRGHYIQHNRMIAVPAVAAYGDLLRQNGVIVDQAERRGMISAGLAKAAAGCAGLLKADEELVDTVTFLVEMPHVVSCQFDERFLEVPDVALIAEMREHQKYFSVMDERGRLTKNFLAVSNNPPTQFIKAGNERVISARFNDARFFYTEDRKKKLADRVDSLKDVLFHKDLGSIYDKVERMRSTARVLGESLHLDAETAARVDRAILLSKTDLMTALVYEFPSLQGRVGRIYALEDGEDPAVAEAIEDHYRPRSQDDELPRSMVSVIVSLAEKLDNLFGSFSVGNIPKGSQDPYALRRQANAVVSLLIGKELNLSLRAVLQRMAGVYRGGESLVDKLLEFITGRARTIYLESGFSHDEIDAVLNTGGSDYLELYRRARSVNEFRKNPKFSEMLLSFKRMNNIVAAFRRENPGYPLAFDSSLPAMDEERELRDFFESRRETIVSSIAVSNYVDLFELLIKGKTIVDAFFEKVLVMDKDLKIRDNRLSVLADILSYFAGLIDFSRIEEKPA